MSKHIYIIAGEASGDFLGAQLMRAIKAQNPEVIFSGIGGDLMGEEGMQSFFPIDELSIMGVAEIAPKIPHMIKRIRQTVADIEHKNPDIVITIDAPDFSFRVQKKLRQRCKSQCRQVHYVAPTVWAWRPKRAQKIAQFLDAIICLFPFEPPYFERENLRAIAVGHPVMETNVLTAAPLMLDNSPKLGVFFGSRHGEIKRMSPVILEAVKQVIKEKPSIELIIPTLPRLKSTIESLLHDIDVPKHIITSKDQKWSAFRSIDAAMAVSGTVGLELSVADVPHLITYKTNLLTYQLLKRIIKTKYAHLTNIILQKEVVPEFIQNAGTPENISRMALKLLNDKKLCDFQRVEFNDMRKKIGQSQKPSDTAAEFILSL